MLTSGTLSTVPCWRVDDTSDIPSSTQLLRQNLRRAYRYLNYLNLLQSGFELVCLLSDLIMIFLTCQSHRTALKTGWAQSNYLASILRCAILFPNAVRDSSKRTCDINTQIGTPTEQSRRTALGNTPAGSPSSICSGQQNLIENPHASPTGLTERRDLLIYLPH